MKVENGDDKIEKNINKQIDNLVTNYKTGTSNYKQFGAALDFAPGVL